MRMDREQKKLELISHAKRVLANYKEQSPKYKEIERRYQDEVQFDDLESKKKKI